MVTTTVYIPEAAVVAAGTLAFGKEAFVIATGPDHEYDVTFAAPTAVRSSVEVAHIGLLFVAPVRNGTALTVTDTLYWVVGAQPGCVLPSDTVNVYMPVAIGVAVGLVAVVEDNAAPAQVNCVAPPDGFAKR